MASKYQRTRRQKKDVRRKKTGTSFDGSELLSDLRRRIDDRWPGLSPRVASFVQASREKLEDIYSSAARAIAEHKEAFEDRLAERNAASAASIRESQQESSVRRMRRRVRRVSGTKGSKDSDAGISDNGAEA